MSLLDPSSNLLIISHHDDDDDAISTNSSSRSFLLKTLLLLAALCGSAASAANIGRIDAVADIEGVGDGADPNPNKKKVVFASPTSSLAATPQDAPVIDRRRNNRNLSHRVSDNKKYDRVFRWTETGSKAAKAAEAETEMDHDGNCEEPEVYCGMTVPAGKALKLKHDLHCTKDSANRGDDAVAITLEPGAKIECNGYSVVQVNDKVGKASRTECQNNPYPVSNGECGLAWGRTGIKLESGATAEHCKATGWVHGFSMVATTDDQELQNDIDGCDASLNTYGVGIDYVDAPGPYFLNFSIEQRYVYIVLLVLIPDPAFFCFCINLSHTLLNNKLFCAAPSSVLLVTTTQACIKINTILPQGSFSRMSSNSI